MTETAARDTLLLGETYCGYSTHAGIRAAASSGGIVSAILISALENGDADAALVSGISSADGHIKAVSTLAQTPEAVLDAAGSAYIYTPVIAAVRSLEHTEQRAAVVALPCQARALRALLDRRPALRRNVILIVGLFCRGAVRAEFYDDWLRKKGIDPGTVDHIKVKRGHVHGDVHVTLRDGSSVSFDFFELNAYRTAGIHAHPACLKCTEHLAGCADISVGDIFTPEYAQRPIKHSCFVPRTNAGLAALRRLQESGGIVSEYFGSQRYQETFRKIESFTNNLSSRAIAARIAGLNLPDKQARRSHPLHALAWIVFSLCYRVSRTSGGRRLLYALPPFVIKTMALLVKGCSKM